MPPPSPADAVVVTPAMLRTWPLPAPEGTKEARGRTLIIGGSGETPGAVLLAAEAALRSGAGKLQVATVGSVAALVAVALPEALVRGLAETDNGAIAPHAADDVLDLAEDAASVLVGPGMADVDACTEFVGRLLPGVTTHLVLDALAMAAVTADVGAVSHLDGRAVLTPNPGELARTLGVDEAEVSDRPAASASRLSSSAKAVVALGGQTSWVAAPDGRLWHDETGGSGLGVSGSGDVLAGIVAGLVARGAEPDQAAVWATHLHGRAGERLAASVGRLGFLARELLPEVPRVLEEVDQ
jgi:ADP-dependent NAD(P)H-hydrate dehydratase